MKVTTQTGSVYDIDESSRICVKTDVNGNHIDTFKCFTMKPVPEETATMGDVYALPNGDPVVGQRLYLSGLNTWWISTAVVSVEP